MKQQTALEILKTGRNVFLTGAAGAGKTYVLNKYIDYLKEHNVPVALTASTGIAATHINGMTIHSFSGIGIKDYLDDWAIDALSQKQYLQKRFENLEVLIIDEVSMLSAQFIDSLNELIKVLRRNTEPFGGLQVVFAGDFFQLPPVKLGADGFAYNAASWQTGDIRVCYLTEQYRQDSDEYLDLLNKIRDGNDLNIVEKILQKRIINSSSDANVRTRLYTHNIDVDEANRIELQKIKGKTRFFSMSYGGRKNLINSLVKSVLAPEQLELKQGAVVMFVKNDPLGSYVNGTLGEIVDFARAGNPIVKTNDGKIITAEREKWSIIDDSGKELAFVEQFPLRLAWAITIHKSQGMTLDGAVMDLSKTFTPGQGYVALSRLKSLENLFLLGFNKRALELAPEVRNEDNKFQEQSSYWENVIEKFSDTKISALKKEFISKAGTIKPQEVERLNTYQKTLKHIDNSNSIQELAQSRDLSEDTIIKHIEKLILSGELNPESVKKFVALNKKDIQKIKDAFINLQTTKLKKVFEYLNEKYTYTDLKLVKIIYL